ncbi:leucine--tRNA ligase [bacterium]|nr:leucine--tRNA ligase [bacterium]
MYSNEKYWREYWIKNKIFKTKEEGKKFYVLEMFPYPSGDLHMGHLRNYVIGDVYARYYKMLGYSVLHPMGWDAFGLPAENAAIKKEISPKDWTLSNISVSKNTFKEMGISYDWDREVTTCLPDYYKWTQWIFIKLYEKGLAYRKESPVNWCPDCKTVLANEQVEDGKCYRCGAEVIKKNLTQWYFKITKYADRLLDDLEKLDKWPEKVKMMQKNWIGRSNGVTVRFPFLHSRTEFIDVYTTRPDTLYGVTFMAIAPENPIIQRLPMEEDIRKKVDKYIKTSGKKSEIERAGSKTEKDGVFTGIYVKNPLTNQKVAVFVGDYVLASYGTGAVMGVPAHDTRDFSFAKKYDIPIKIVIQPKDKKINDKDMKDAYIETGIMENSEQFSGMLSTDAKEQIIEHLEKIGWGERTVNYRLRDWLISRQRYWGTPIPMIHCPKCGIVPEKIENLPVLLPDPHKVDYIPKGKSPLASVEEFVNTTCPVCGGPAKRDTDTMDTFVDSSWYYLRYSDANNEKEIFSKDKLNYWMPVDLYIGGVEHAILHLLFSRFITKFLCDEGLIKNDEPFKELFTQGMVMNRVNGNLEVMSKSKGNAIPVGPFVEKEGSDVARGTILFIAPPEKALEWNEESVQSIKNFMRRIVHTVEKIPTKTVENDDIDYEINFLIESFSHDLQRFKLNTAVSSLMKFINFTEKSFSENKDFGIPKGIKEKFIIVMAPIFPHLAEKLWNKTGNENSVFLEKFPKADRSKLEKEEIEIVVQVKGKIRGRINITSHITEEKLKELVMEIDNVRKFIDNKPIKKIIYIPKKLVNIIV